MVYKVERKQINENIKRVNQKKLRKFHHFNSVLFLNNEIRGSILDETEEDILRYLIIGHRGSSGFEISYRISQIEEKWPANKSTNEQIRLQFLVALIRLGDVLDANIDRAPPSLLKGAEIIEEQIEHWRKHQHIHRLKYDPTNQQIILYVSYKYDYEKIENIKKSVAIKDVERVCNEIWSDFYPAKQIFQKNGIDFNRIKVLIAGEKNWYYREFFFPIELSSNNYEELNLSLINETWQMVPKLENKCLFKFEIFEEDLEFLPITFDNVDKEVNELLGEIKANESREENSAEELNDQPDLAFVFNQINNFSTIDQQKRNPEVVKTNNKKLIKTEYKITLIPNQINMNRSPEKLLANVQIKDPSKEMKSEKIPLKISYLIEEEITQETSPTEETSTQETNSVEETTRSENTEQKFPPIPISNEAKKSIKKIVGSLLDFE